MPLRQLVIHSAALVTAAFVAAVALPRRTAAQLPPGVQAISLLGDTLRTFPLAAETRATYERRVAAAQAA
jgi:hypothetical protein